MVGRIGKTWTVCLGVFRSTSVSPATSFVAFSSSLHFHLETEEEPYSRGEERRRVAKPVRKNGRSPGGEGEKRRERGRGGRWRGERERGFNEAGAHPMALMTLINCTKDGDQPLCTSHGNKRNLEEVLLTCLSPALSSARYANLKRSACSTRLLRVSSYFLFIRSPVTASLTTVKANERPKEKFLPKFANHRKIFRNSSSSTYTSTLKNDKERWNYEMGRVVRQKGRGTFNFAPTYDTKRYPFRRIFDIGRAEIKKSKIYRADNCLTAEWPRRKYKIRPVSPVSPLNTVETHLDRSLFGVILSDRPFSPAWR